MATPADNTSMAVFCDFENVALGVRDAKYEKFDMKLVLERLLLKGSIVVKKAYCDWERYKGFKATMHEANFELIEIPHLRMSGKNSADIRLVVDALDLCYTKAHVNTFVIISGDSDFSPLVSKLRENAKQVIGVGVKQSTSDLLIANCDEFIFYDDLVRETRRHHAKRDSKSEQEGSPIERRADDEKQGETHDKRRSQAIELVLETFEALIDERGDSGKIWASVLKQAIKRRKPDFNESYYGFRSFGSLIEEAQKRGLLEFGRDDKNGAYVVRSQTPGNAAASQPTSPAMPASPAASAESAVTVAEVPAPATSHRERHPSRAAGAQEMPTPAGEAASPTPAASNKTSTNPGRKPARQRAKERKSSTQADRASHGDEASTALAGAVATADASATTTTPTSTPSTMPATAAAAASESGMASLPAESSRPSRNAAASASKRPPRSAGKAKSPASSSEPAQPDHPAPETAAPASAKPATARRRRPTSKAPSEPTQESS